MVGGGPPEDAATAAASPLHQARQDPLHQPPRCGPDVGAGLAAQRARRRLLPGLRPAPAAQLRAGPADGRESVAEYLDVRLGGRRDLGETPVADAAGDLLASAAAARGDRGHRGGPGGEAVPASLQQEVTSCSWELEVLGVTASELVERVEQPARRPQRFGAPGAQGPQASTTTSAPVRSLASGPSPDAPVAGLRLRCSPIGHPPAGVRPGSWWRRSAPIWCSDEPAGRNSGSSMTAPGGSRSCGERAPCRHRSHAMERAS